MSEKQIELSGLNFHVLDEGSGQPVLLLHGFPDSADLWRNQIPALVDAGFRAIAPDLRGFGRSSKPKEISSYSFQVLLSDIIGILDALQIERVHVVGHDWGAALAWFLAAFRPDRVMNLAVMSVGHLNSFRSAGLEQREKSWYTLLFQFEEIAEQLLMKNDWQFFRDLVRHHSELERWIPAMEKPDALSAALSIYRANAHPQKLLEESSVPAVKSPTLGIWSSGDFYLTEAQMLGSNAFVDAAWKYVRVEGASHWMQLDRPEVINQILLKFLR
ncbi:alpha/beta fold hydrolase [Mastigocoleus testarum]|uniref:AB hydrolase-1 domain-containing protein n=1 Tax=Mastigocoleus testarum BC008 TaxID=371196 RepID=A0A0V7ZM04_9CYAN|nr:alpha/beta hydrolase [Mastigocoleus testarum]KST65480.1 hypothetical protein BC008_41870 [Mastigocoleus testarum BC008]